MSETQPAKAPLTTMPNHRQRRVQTNTFMRSSLLLRIVLVGNKRVNRFPRFLSGQQLGLVVHAGCRSEVAVGIGKLAEDERPGVAIVMMLRGPVPAAQIHAHANLKRNGAALEEAAPDLTYTVYGLSTTTAKLRHRQTGQAKHGQSQCRRFRDDFDPDVCEVEPVVGHANGGA